MGNRASAHRNRTLLLVGFAANDALQQLAQSLSSSFRIRRLPATSGNSTATDAVTVRTKDGIVDRSHLVTVVLNANVEPSAKSLKDSTNADNANPEAEARLDTMLQLCHVIRAECPHAFVVLWHEDAVEDARLRMTCFSAGASMVTCFPAHLEEALRKVASIGSGGPGAGGCSCAWCGQSGLTPDELWLHQPLYHIYDPNRGGTCCACGDKAGNLAVHIHEQHYPGGPRPEARRGVGAAVVVHRRRDNKFLMVQEFAGQGYWVPGGGTDPGETLRTSALRECLEEAGVEVDLVGLAEVDCLLSSTTGKPVWCLAVFYAVIRDEAAQPKTVPCFESAGACWVGADELDQLPLRSARVPCKWFPHFAAGGAAKPLELPDELQTMFCDIEF